MDCHGAIAANALLQPLDVRGPQAEVEQISLACQVKKSLATGARRELHVGRSHK
jgi:hypothetical protein